MKKQTKLETMKKRVLFLSWMLIALGGGLLAQDAYKGQVRVSGLHFYQKSNMLQVEMDINYDGLQIDSNESLTMTPYLQNADQRLDLPSVLVNGLQEQKAYHRAEVLGKGNPSTPDAKVAERPIVVLDKGRMKVNEFNYKVEVPFQDWMYACSLFMEFKECGCNGKTAHTFEDCLAEQPNIERPRTSTITPDIDRKILTWIHLLPAPLTVEQNLSIAGNIPLNNANLFRGNSQRKLNHEVYYKLLEAVREVRQMKGVEITTIDVTGYSSPIGNLEKNERKALNRSLSLKEYLYDTGLAGKANLNVRWVAEDWDSITSLVKASDMMLREAVLDLIQQIDVSRGRETMLSQLADGGPYKYLTTKIFPQVRRVEYTIRFQRQASGIEDSRFLLKNRPDVLSLEEFFALASSYPKGSTEFNDVYDLAARLFPNSPEACINAGAVALTRKDLQRAHKYLDPYAALPQASCNMGLLHLLEGNREKAEVYLSLAKANGVTPAAAALEYLKSKP
jgi:outer membrane protein OmpA-like peptidoglycan-associated protein